MSSVSTLNSQSKGDNKKKFSSLDINKHYKGKGVETQRSSVTGRHGLQSLGKVQTAVRRMPAPVNLPSLKSENLGNDPTVNLVPTGPGSTWGTSKESSQSSHQQEAASRTQQTSGGQSRSSSTAGASAPQQQGERGGVGTASHHRHQDQRQQSQQQSSSSVGGAAGKSWSSVTTRGLPFDQERPPPSSGGSQNSRFTREFPTLDNIGAGGGGKNGAGTLSSQLELRPQNVGSWREGGGRNITSDPQTSAGSSAGGRGVEDDQDIPYTSGRGDREDAQGRGGDPDHEYDRSYGGYSGGGGGAGSRYNSSQKPQGQQSAGAGEDRLFKRQNIVKDRDIEELGQKAASRANNDDSSWATATGDVDYSVKLVFSDDEDNTTTTTSSSQSRATAGRDGGDKRSSQPDQMSKSVDRSRGDRSPDRRSQSEQRAGREYDNERDRGREPPPMSPRDPPRDGWTSGGSGGGQYPPYPPGHMMHPQQRMQFDMWQRAQSAGGGKMQPPNMPPPGAYNMPYRMSYPGGGGPPGGGGGRSGPPSRDMAGAGGEEDDDNLWSKKQRQTQSEVMSAVEKARSRRAADGGGTSHRNEQGGDRRSRSASESSSSEQNSAAMSRSRYNDGPRDNKKQHSQIPPRFQQQRSVERSREDRDPERQQRGEEGRPSHPQHPPSAQGGPGWPMGWPMPPPMGFMPGMPMPTMPPPPSRPRNNSRGSDDERRTPDTQGYGVNPAQVYEIQMRQWMHMMTEFAKNHPDAPKPPVPPHIMMAAAQAQHRGQPFPQGPPTSAGMERRSDKPEQISESSAETRGDTSQSSRGGDRRVSESSRSETDNSDHHPHHNQQHRQHPQQQPHKDRLERSQSRETGGSKASPSAADSKVQSDPFSADAADGSHKSASDDKRRDDGRNSQYNRSSSYRGEGRDDRRGNDKRDDRRDGRREDKSKSERSIPPRHAHQQSANKSTRHADNEDREMTEGGRKRRSEMSAPIPIVKETVRAEPERQSNMVTLRRGGKTTTPSNNGATSSSTTTTKISSDSASTKPTTAKSTDKIDQKSDRSSSDKSAPPQPKQSAWAPTPVPKAAPIGSEDPQAKESEKENAAPSSTLDDVKSRDHERSKVSPAYSDPDKPPVKRYKDDRSGGEYGGRSDGGRPSRGRGASSSYSMERGRRGGSRSREFVRGGGAMSGTRGGRGGAVGGGYPTTRGGPSGSSRSLSNRGSSRGGSARGGYEPRNRDYRIDTYSTEDWDGEKQFVSKKDSSSSRAKQDGDAVVSKPPMERRSSEEKSDSGSTKEPSSEKGQTERKALLPTPKEAPLSVAPVVSEAPLPKENIWDKRKQEMIMRDTPSPPPTVSTPTPDESAQSERRGSSHDTADSKSAAVGGTEARGHVKSTPATNRPGGIPDGWLDFSAMGRPVTSDTISSRFLCFKAPLKPGLCESLPEADRFTPSKLLSECKNKGYKLGIVIDLTNNGRYCDGAEFEKAGIRYVRIAVVGLEIPRRGEYHKFTDVVKKYIADSGSADKESMIGVHCTHGVHRTGYMVCRYLIESGYDAEQVIQLFHSTRGHVISRDNYLRALRNVGRSSHNLRASDRENWRSKEESQTSAAKDNQGSTEGGRKPEDRDSSGRDRDNSSRRGGARGKSARPDRGTYVAPRGRSRGGYNSRNRNDYYEEYYDEEDDGSGRYHSQRGGGRGRGRSSSSRGYGSTRGRHYEPRNVPPRHASAGANRDSTESGGPKIDQWNGPPAGDDSSKERLDHHGDREGEHAGDRDDYAPHSSYRGRGRGRGGRYSTRGGSASRGGRGRYPVLPSAPHSPSKRRQDSTTTENDAQEEWETASESSDHLKDSAPASSAATANSADNRSRSSGGHAGSSRDYSQHDPSGAPNRSNGSTTHRGGSARGSYRGERSERPSRGRGLSTRGARGGYSSSAGRGATSRDGRYSKERSPDSKMGSGGRGGRGGGKPLPNGKSSHSTTASVYRIDDITPDNPSAIASALSNKNSELSDVTKPLSSKERAASKSQAKEQASAPVDPLDGFDLNNYAGVVIIDEISTGQHDDSDGWQDEDGFQEVVSRKTKNEKKRAEHEAAQKAAALELIRKEKAAASAAKKMNGSAARSTSPHRKSKLPPRLAKQREEKMKLEKFKIENWNNDMGKNNNGQASTQLSHHTGGFGGAASESPVSIDNWDQELAASAPPPAAAVSVSTPHHADELTAVQDKVTSSGVALDQPLHIQAPVVGTGVKPGDKSSEQHDSGIDVSCNDKDSGSVRSSPDAGSLSVTQQVVSSRQNAAGSMTSSQAPPHFSTSLPNTHEAAVTSHPVMPSMGNTGNSSLGGASGGRKLEFIFDPELARIAELKEQSNSNSPSSDITAANEANADLNMKLDSVKTLWDSPSSVVAPKANTTQSSSLFGGNQTTDTTSSNTFQQSAETTFDQVDMPSAADTAFQSANASEGFPGRSEGFPTVGDNSSYHHAMNAGTSQSASDLFGSSTSNMQGDVNSGAVGTARPSQQSPRNSQLLTPRDSSSAPGGAGVGVSSSVPSSSHSVLDGSASAFTPSRYTSQLPSSVAAMSQPPSYGFMGMVQQQPSVQQQTTDPMYQSYNRSPASVAQPPSLNQSLQQSALSQQMGVMQQPAHQQPTQQQQQYPQISQAYQQAMIVSTSSIMSPIVKQNTGGFTSATFPSVGTKIGQFGDSGLTNPQTTPMYVPGFDMQGLMGSQQASAQQAFRIQPPTAQPGQQAGSQFYAASAATQSAQQPTPAPPQQLGFFPATLTGGTNSLQSTGASPFGMGLMQTPQGAAMLPSASLVIGQQPTVSGWGQPPPSTAALQQSSVAQQIKQQQQQQQYNKQSAVNAAAAAQIKQINQQFQLSASGNFSGQPQPGTVGDFMGVASQHMQQASAPPPKWSNSTNQQAESKPMMGGPSQMQAANQMQAAHKMGGANNQMKQMNPQMQKPMGGAKPPGVGYTQVPPGPAGQQPRPPFNPRHMAPNATALVGPPHHMMGQPQHRHSAPHMGAPQHPGAHRPPPPQGQYVAQQAGMAPPNQQQQQRGAPPTHHNQANRYPGPIQRPAQNRQGGRSSKTPPTNHQQQHASKSGSNTSSGNTGGPGAHGETSRMSQEERRKMREAAILSAKSFLNPENKPHPSQVAAAAAASTPPATTPSPPAAAGGAGTQAVKPQTEQMPAAVSSSEVEKTSETTAPVSTESTAE